jgi:hypothetical protein
MEGIMRMFLGMLAMFYVLIWMLVAWVCLVCENELGSTIMIAVLSDTVIMFFFCL